MTRISTRHLDRLSIILNYVRQDMTFEEYIEIIKGSVAETGYDNFRPSLCIPGEQIKMDVFDTSLSQAGEEILAKEWASQFTEQDKTLFLAFRSGQRTITVIKIVGTEATKKQGIIVNRYAEP
ncbi:MAG TPA: hypothetical protein VIS99_06975 [Terrimicrobiaceae bacterium]